MNFRKQTPHFGRIETRSPAVAEVFNLRPLPPTAGVACPSSENGGFPAEVGNFRPGFSIITLILLSASARWTRAEEPVSYEKEIAPILRSHCAGCHNDKDLEGKLSVETFTQLRKGGEDHADPIKPGDAEASFFMRSLEGREKPKMPPKDEPPLPPEDLATLKKWILAGAPGPKEDVSILRTLTTPKVAASAKVPPVTAADFSRDGRLMAVARAGSIEIRDAATQAVVRTLSGLPAKVNAVHFTAGDRQVILAGGITGLHGVAQLRDATTGALVREFAGHSDVLYDAEISPDGKTLATAGYDRVIRLWQVEDGKPLRSIDVHKGAVFALAWHPDGKVLASASADETVKLWRVSDGLRLDTLNQPQGEMTSVLFTPDGTHIIAAGSDRRIHLWKFVSREAPALNPPLHSRFAHESAVSAIALSADGRHLLSSADDRTLKLWTVPDLVLEHAYPAQPDIASVLLAGPRPDSFLAGRMDGSTEVIPSSASSGQPAPPVAVVSGGSATPPPAAGTEAPEAEPNNSPAQAMAVQIPAMLKGSVSAAGDTDLFRFHAAAGQELTLEVNAARSKSKLDSRLEILHPDGTPVEQVVLQATRDSWFTFRGKDSDTSDDFRLHNWAEMELNEYLYANGEVVKLWLYPRGPDSGYKVYPGAGRRQTCFGTPALVHALGAPAYVVTPLPPGSQPPPNGLPVFHVNYENDDDSSRRLGADSQVLFTALVEGDYLVRLTDVRGFGGPGYDYALAIRPRNPDFTASIGGLGPKISPGSGREVTFSIERLEGFEGPVRIDVANLPPGFTASTPVEIEAGQSSAIAVINAAPAAMKPDDAAVKAIKVTATGRAGGKEISKDLGGLGDLQLGPVPKLAVEILPDTDRSFVKEVPGQPLELSIHPGQTITALVKATRADFTGRIELGGDDCGRNLPHGLYVDNVGLNGLLIVEGQTERQFFITASRIAKPGTSRLFHLRATADGGQASRPVLIRVLPPVEEGLK